jgi:hypothetical protein
MAFQIFFSRMRVDEKILIALVDISNEAYFVYKIENT